MADTGVAHYYDRLHRWNVVADALGYGGGRRSLTVHRRLADPRNHGWPTTTRLHDVILELLPRQPSARLLDAGCGLGGTMLALAPLLGCDCTGITLSQTQADVANAAARERGLEGSVRAHVQSYDAPPAGPFDIVLAIESLAHSADPIASVRRLLGVLSGGGTFLVVDDMPEESAIGRSDFEVFTTGWESPHICSRAGYLRAFADAGLTVTADIDLTGDTRPRSLPQIARLDRLNRLAAAVVPSAAFRQVMRSHRGGLALERLARQGHVRYRLLMARRDQDATGIQRR